MVFLLGTLLCVLFIGEIIDPGYVLQALAYLD
jgi:hypothetical protein